MKNITIKVIPSFPLIKKGDDLGDVIFKALNQAALKVEDGDVLVVAQKVISKAEGRLVKLKDVTPSEEANTLASETDKDPRLVQLILEESTQVVRKKQGVMIVRHKLGHVGANAGIDQSNIEHSKEGSALLLPVSPDTSALRLRKYFKKRCGISIGVIISDSMNRPWRMGSVGETIGSSGLAVLDDRRGETDMYGRELKITLINQADALSSIATLAMGETSEATPVVLIKGLNQEMNSSQTASDIIRPREDDLFCD